MDTINRPGWIEIVTGPMFAGKSEELIRRIKRLEYAKKKVLVFRPRIDNRYSLDEVVSHSNNRRKSIVIDAAKDILPYISEDTYAVVIDEIQFLDHELISLSEHLANIGIRVILGGLDSDFRGEPFAVTAEMMARAEFVTKLTAICVRCGSPATKTQRIVNGKPAHYLDPIVVVGAAEAYEPRCRHCHEVLGKAK
ncbi:MAG TPA: thymidine kinase [Bacilli bacterium]|nr:thymidine kinase [Bacilli bacterium]HOR20818.1 thymidine kinase [Bacilli bacterium]HPY38495.1 thymidine kinase [Bacilli bacterium]HQC32896.1 thymidine kinase [Bacilli bacterium]